jgi:hypothetical protein
MTSARNEKHIIIIIIIIISFMQGILTYIPETNYVHREYSVAAILLLLFMVLIPSVSVLNLLYIYISTFRSICAVIIIIIIIIGGGGHFARCALQHKCQFSVPFPLAVHVCHYKNLRIKSSQSLQGSCRNHALCKCTKSPSIYHTCVFDPHN